MEYITKMTNIDKQIAKEVLTASGINSRQDLSDAIEKAKDELEILTDFGFVNPEDTKQHELCGYVRTYSKLYEDAFGVPYILDRPKLIETEKYQQ